MIVIAIFVVLTGLWFLILSNAHMLDILPCTELDYDGNKISTTCGIIDVTRHAYLSEAELTGFGYVLAALVVLFPPALVSFFVAKKVK